MRGHVQKVDEGTFRVYVDAGRDPITGRRRRLTKTVHGTQREAEEEAAKLVVQASDGFTPTNALTFGQLLDRWLENANLEAWTRIGYESKIENHIRPALGTLKVEKITTYRLDNFYRALRKKLSPQSVTHVHAVIHRALNQAVKWGWLNHNAATATTRPSIDQRKKPLPSIDDILAISEKLTPDMRELAWLALVTGARRGELCGLRWSDVDLERGSVTIAQSVADTPAEVIVKATKTNKERRVAIDAQTVAMLIHRREGMVEKAKACKVKLDRHAYVFADSPGGKDPLRPALVTKRWANAATSAKVKCRFHDLRHFAITELLDAGFEVGAVSKRAGHASIVMTHERYQHVRGNTDLAASEHLAGLLAPKEAAE